ncbi:hypothetical protein [Campylobacter fetus]|nr:hypothetical protein [Campylobacter fetus]
MTIEERIAQRLKEIEQTTSTSTTTTVEIRTVDNSSITGKGSSGF